MRSLMLSLLLAPALMAAAPGAAPSDVISQKVDSVEAWPEGKTFVEAPGLTFDLGTPKFKDGPSGTDSYRMLRLDLKPGEKVSFKLKSEYEKVSMRTYMPHPFPESLEWRMALRNANLPRRECRKEMSVTNSTDKPQSLILIIFGVHAHSYRVDLERTPKA